MPGAGGIRIPTEVFGSGGPGNRRNYGSREANHYRYGSFGGRGQRNPYSSQTAASYITVTGSGAFATTLNLPAAFPGTFYVLFNNTANNVTLKVTGQTGIVVATGKRALLVCEATDIARVTADT